MFIRNLLEKLYFFFKKIPSYIDVKRVPDGKRYLIDSSNITIGNMPWKPGWNKDFEWGLDPHFRWNKPYSQDTSSLENIAVEDGRIVMTLPKESNSKEAVLFSNFTIKYGTVRALVKLPKIKGAWSAFWLFGTNGMPEHDIFEHCGGWENKVSVTHHWGYDYNGVKGKKATRWNARENKNFTPREGYYLYEVELTPYKTTYSINGVKVRTMKQGLSSGENTVIFGVGKGDYCNSNVSQAIETDAKMSIQYIEVFKIS